MLRVEGLEDTRSAFQKEKESEAQQEAGELLALTFTLPDGTTAQHRCAATGLQCGAAAVCRELRCCVLCGRAHACMRAACSGRSAARSQHCLLRSVQQ